MKEICLTKGYVALVDDEDYIWLGGWKWRTLTHSSNINHAHNSKEGYMHVKIFKYHDLWIPGLQIDHKNRNGLDNQKENLRNATDSQNKANGSLQINNTSGFRGVSWCQKRSLWYVAIKVNGRKIPLGHYTNLYHAARVYNYWAKFYFREFASLNDVPDD